jgi:DNA-binding winged helix-turn-helix (wHTH) protein
MITAGSTAHQPWLAATGLHSPRANGRTHDLQFDEHLAAADRSAAQAEGAIEFGPFHLLPTRRLLLEAGKPVRLGSRALEILIALIERPGELVSKAELTARVWPDTFVEAGNLKVQVAGLRRALGDNGGSNRYLATIPGRGYRFVAPVTRTDEATLSAPRAAAAAPDLPAPMTLMIDRADSVEALTAQLPHQRFITVVGPGGIGKTTVALAVARSWPNHASTAPASSIWRRCSTRVWCRARSPPGSAWRSAPATRSTARSRHCGASRCCLCSITASTSSRLPPPWRPRC